MTEIVTLGEALIDFVSTESGVALHEAPGFRRRFGGSPANTAVGLARLGRDAGFTGMVGTDAFGRYLEDQLEREGVDTEGLRRTDRARTTLAFVSLTEQGVPDFEFHRHPGADECLTPEDLPRSMVEEARVVHTGSLALSSKDVRRSAFRAMDWARASDTFVSLDPNLRLTLWDSDQEARKDVMEAVSRARLVKLSEEEAKFLTGEDDLSAAAEALREKGPELVVVTRGAEGSFYQSERAEGVHPGYSVDVRDTTGAGDAFNAGLLSYLLEEGSLDPFPPGRETLGQTLRYASATAAITCTEVGATTAFPGPSEVEDFLGSRAD